MTKRHWCVIVGLSIAPAVNTIEAEASSCLVYTANIGADNVSVIDAGTNTLAATIPVGRAPDGIAASPDGTAVYVANAFTNDVSVIDTGTNQVVATVPVGQNPIGVAFTPDGVLAWVANYATPGSISIIDTSSRTVVGTVSVAAGPHHIAISPDGTRAFATHQVYSPGIVSVIDVPSRTVVRTVSVGANPAGLAMTPDGAKLFTANNNSNDSSILDTATYGVTSVAAGLNPADAAITPNGLFAWIVNVDFYTNTGGSISIIDTATRGVVHSIPLGSGTYPDGIAFVPDGSTAYVGLGVCCGGTSGVAVIDTASRSVVATVPVGTNPSGVAVACKAAPPTPTPLPMRGTSLNPRTDRRACQLLWRIENPSNPPDRYGLPSYKQGCTDGDPSCDADPTPGVCGFIAQLCLNNEEPLLPSCVPSGITKVDVIAPRPEVYRIDALRQTYADDVAAIQDALRNLTDPAKPMDGSVYGPPLSSSQLNLCSEPFLLRLPVDRSTTLSKRRSVDVRLSSADNSSPIARKRQSRMRLTCKALPSP